MARPLKQGLDYFPLDCQLDDKFELIEAEYGLIGFAVVVKLFQKIYGQNGYYTEWTDEVALLFAKRIGAGGGVVSEIVKAAIRRGIFDKGLFEKYHILTSAGIQKRYLEIVSRRKSSKIKNEYLLVKYVQNNENVDNNGINVDNNPINDDNNTQSKVNKSKINKTERVRVRKTLTRFEEFLSAYPKECNRHLTEIAYANIVSSGTEVEENLIACAKNYAEACRIQGVSDRYIKNAENFLKDFAFERYLPSNYKKPASCKPQNSFNNFEQRDYDFVQLERELLGEGNI